MEEFQLRWYIPDLLQFAWRFQWHLMNLNHVPLGCSFCLHLHQTKSTIFVSCPEVVLDCLDNVWLNIFLFFKSNWCAIYELPFPILCDCWGWTSGFCWTLLNLGWKKCDSLDEISQHVYDINQLIKFDNFTC